MTMLITLEEAAADLKITGNNEDKDLTRKIKQASAGILAYLGDADFLDSDGDIESDGVPDLIQQAVILWLRDLYSGGDGMTSTVKNILDLYGRTPTLA